MNYKHLGIVILMIVVSMNKLSPPVILAQSDDELDDIIAMEWNNTGEYLAVSTFEGVYLLNRQYSIIASLSDERLTDLTWSPNGYYLAGIHGIREIDIPEIYIWDVSSPNEIHLVTQFSDMVGSLGYPLAIKWHPTEDLLLVNGPGVSVWDIAFESITFTSRENTENVFIQDDGVYVNAIDWSPDGAFFAGGYANTLKIWSTSTHEQVIEIDIPKDGQTSDLVWNSNGDQIALARSSNVLIFNVETEELTQTLSPNTELRARNLRWEGDFLALLQVYPNRSIQIWNTKSGELISETSVDDLTDIAWNPSYTGLVNRATAQGLQAIPSPFVVTLALIQQRLENCVDDETSVELLDSLLNSDNLTGFTEHVNGLPDDKISNACTEDLNLMVDAISKN